VNTSFHKLLMRLSKLVCIVLFMFFIPLLFNLSFSWYYSEWKYRKEITVEEKSNQTLTDYQVEVHVDTASLISSGWMNSDCSDIRFTWLNESSGEEVEVPYWIYKGCNTNDTFIFVKVPEIPALGTVTLYMYYGNPDASPASNYSDTMGIYTIWSKTLDFTSNEDGANDVVIGPDGTIYVAGYKDYDSDTHYGYWVIAAFSPEGDLLWNVTSEYTKYIKGGSGIAMDSEGYLYVAGPEYYDYNYYGRIEKYDSNGNLVASVSFDWDIDDERFVEVAIDNEDRIWAVGQVNIGDHPDGVVVGYYSNLTKIGAESNVWTTLWEGVATDSSYIYVVGTDYSTTDYPREYLRVYDYDLSTVCYWIGPEDYRFLVTVTLDGDFVVAAGGEVIVKLKKDCTLVWRKKGYLAKITSIIRDSMGDYIIVGHRDSSPNSIYLKILDSDGNVKLSQYIGDTVWPAGKISVAEDPANPLCYVVVGATGDGQWRVTKLCRRKLVYPEPSVNVPTKNIVNTRLEYVKQYYVDGPFYVKVKYKRVDTGEVLVDNTTCVVEYNNTNHTMTYDSDLNEYVYYLEPDPNIHPQEYKIYCTNNYVDTTGPEPSYFMNNSEVQPFDYYIGKVLWPLYDRPYKFTVHVKNPSDYPILDYIMNVTIDTATLINNSELRSDCLDFDAVYRQRVGYIKFKVCNPYSKTHNKWYFTYTFDPDVLSRYAIHQPGFIDVIAFTYKPEYPNDPYLNRLYGEPDVDAYYVGNNKFLFVLDKALDPGQCTNVYVFFGGYNKNYAYKYPKWKESYAYFKDFRYIASVAGFSPDKGFTKEGAWPYFYNLSDWNGFLNKSDENENLFNILFISPFSMSTDKSQYNTYYWYYSDGTYEYYRINGSSEGTSLNIYTDNLMKLFSVNITDLDLINSTISGKDSPFLGLVFTSYQTEDQYYGEYFAYYDALVDVYKASVNVEEINSTYSWMSLPVVVENCNASNTSVYFLIPILYPKEYNEIYIFFGDGEAHAVSGDINTMKQIWFEPISQLRINKIEPFDYLNGFAKALNYHIYFGTRFMRSDAYPAIQLDYDSNLDGVSIANTSLRQGYKMIFESPLNALPSTIREKYYFSLKTHVELFANDTDENSPVYVGANVNGYSLSLQGVVNGTSYSRDVFVTAKGDSNTFYITLYMDGWTTGNETVDAYSKLNLTLLTITNPEEPEIIEYYRDHAFRVSEPKPYDAVNEVVDIISAVPSGANYVEYWMKRPDGEIELIGNKSGSDMWNLTFDFSPYPEGYYELWVKTDYSGESPIKVKVYVDHSDPTAIIESPEPVVYYTKDLTIKLYGDDNYGISACYYKLDENPWQEIPCGLPIKIYNLLEGEHTFTGRVVDRVGLMSEDSVVFNVYKYYGGLAPRPTPAPTRGPVITPVALRKIVEREIAPYRRATIALGISSILFIILTLLGLI